MFCVVYVKPGHEVMFSHSVAATQMAIDTSRYLQLVGLQLNLVNVNGNTSSCSHKLHCKPTNFVQAIHSLTS